MIVDHTYFVGEINLAQLSSPVVLESFNFFNKKYQKKFLREVLGIELAKLFEADLAKPVGDREQRFIDIEQGKAFEVEDENFEWIGLVNSDKLSPLANYVFYFIVIDGQSYQTGVGESYGASENANRTIPDGRLVMAWNEMVNWIETLIKWIDSSQLYPEYKPLVAFEKINTFNL